MRRRALALVLTAALALGATPAIAYATGETPVDVAAGETATEGVMPEEDLRTAIEDAEEGGVVALSGDVKITAPIVVSRKLTLDLDGHTISAAQEIWDEDDGHWSLVRAARGSDLTITGNGTLQALPGDTFAVDVVGDGRCTIEDGTFVGNVHSVYVLEGELVVKGGTFSVQQKYSDATKPYEFVLNCHDKNYQNGKASILVKGGTFKNFDPANCEAEGEGTSFMSADCARTSSGSGDDTTWIVSERQGISVEKTQDPVSGAVDVTVGGKSIVGGSGENGVTTIDGSVVVDATVADTDNTVSTANVTVGGAALTAVSKAENVSDLVIETNVGTLGISKDALDSIIAEATSGDVISDVTLSIQRVSGEDDATGVTYDLTAKTGGKTVFIGGSSTATISVTVRVPESMAIGSTAYIYYLDSDETRSLEATATVSDDHTVTWDVTHFSKRLITSTQDEATYETEGGGIASGPLADAIKHVKDGGTVTLNTNVDLTIPVNVEKKLTLNLNGKTITNNWTTDSSADYLVGVARGGDLTIIDSVGMGAIKTDSVACGVKVTLTGENTAEIPAVLTVNGGTIQGKYYGISGNGTRHNTTIVINGGLVRASDPDEGTGIYHPQDGSLTVNGGTISGNTGIEIRSGSLTVTGGDISGGGSEPSLVNNAGGTTASNTGIAVAQHTTGKPITVTITGGTIKGGASVYEGNPQNNNGDSSVRVAIKDSELTGDVYSEGFGSVTIDGSTVEGDVSKTGTGSMGVTRSIINGSVTKGEGDSGTIGFVNSEITGEAPKNNGENSVVYVNTVVGEETFNTTVGEYEAMVDGTLYKSLQTAIDKAEPGDTVELLKNVVLNGADKVNNKGILTITKDIILEGNDKTISANNVAVDEKGGGPSMINIERGASVTVRNLTINGADENGSASTKHGLNIWEGSAELEDVTIKNNRWYAVVLSGDSLVADGLKTEGNQWGINVDGKKTGGKAARLELSDSTISEDSSIVFEQSTPGQQYKATIAGGSYQHVYDKTKDRLDKSELTIKGGAFATGHADGAVNPGDYVADGLVWNASTGKVEEERVPSVPSTPSAPTYDVTVPESEGGKVTVSDSAPEEGDEVTITATPEKGQEVRSVTVTDAEGEAVEVAPGEGENTWVFEMPKGDVTVEVTFGCDGGELCPTHGYADLDQAEWYHDAVDWAVTSGAILGYGDGTFGPGRSLTRAEMATILCRLAGEPDADLEGLPSDVPATEWYANGVAWALAEGVFNGNGDGSFDPAGAITREQAACVLYNRAQAAGEDVSARADLSAFADADELSGWAEEAMSWAVAEGVFSGGAAGLEPGRALTRSEGAAILWNWETRE